MKPLHLVWFLAGYQPRGWLDPRWGAGYDYRKPALYMDAARTLERGCFDGIVIADQQSIDPTYTGAIGRTLRSGNESICGEPLVPLSMMGAATSRIGLTGTFSTSFHPPFLLARQLSALDHMTDGRAGWNVVTSARATDGDNYGKPLPEHDLRYDMAYEYLELCHKLWRSWEPDAVRLDRETGTFADPDKVHEVNFTGQFHSSRGPLPSASSPQVSPVLFQAGGSGRGREFAARHAEAILSNQNSIQGMKDYVDDIRERGKAYGRRPKVFFSIQPVIGDTTAIAKEREQALLALGNTQPYLDGGLAFASMGMGMDLSLFDLDVPVLEQLDKVPAARKGESIRYQYFKSRPNTTPRDMGIKEAVKITLPVVGTGEEVAERLCEIAAETGADGFAIREAFLPSYLNDWVDRVIPALQRRHMFRSEYSGKMFRDHLGEY